MAYAVVLSALEKMDIFMKSSQSNNLELNCTMKFIHDEICYLKSFLKEFTPFNCRKLELDAVDQQIQDLMEKVEDLMESHVVSSSDPLVSDESDGCSLFVAELIKVKRNICSFTEVLKKKLESGAVMQEGQQLGSYVPTDEAVSLMLAQSGLESSELVGLHDEVEALRDAILNGASGKSSIIIRGMVGIGKTTLAQVVYDHPAVSPCFEIRIMVRVGPYCESLDDLMLLVLHHLGFVHEDDYDLKVHLSNILKGKRYMIMLDDVWNTQWTDLWDALPEDFNGSRLIVTTTINHDDYYYGLYHHHVKRFLTYEDSWNLLRKVVFSNSEESCSYELERVGKKIAENCEGLPLAIISIAELLSKVERTVECWKKISEDENPLRIGVDNNTPIAKSVLLSFEMLEYDYQVFLLHVGVFPGHYEVYAAYLVRLWLAEGFIAQEGKASLEWVGEQYLFQLVWKGVVLALNRSSALIKFKKVGVHTVFRNLCINIARNKKFCYVMSKYAYSFPQGTNRQRRLCIHNSVVLSIKEVQNTMESIQSVRSLLCFGTQHEYPLRVYLTFGLLSVLDTLRIRFYEFPYQIPDLLRLRYLAITYDSQLPQSISKLQSLEVLIVGWHHRIKSSTPSYLPGEIWSLKRLRHLKCYGLDIPDPCTGTDGCNNYGTVLEHLLTLAGVSARSCTQKILERVPNLKKLGVHIELAPDEVQTLSFLSDVTQHLHSLESFKFVVLGLRSQVVFTVPTFPETLKKLSLSGCGFFWKDIAPISLLPKLEILKLRWGAFHGSSWNICTNEFYRLRYLLLEDLDIELWTAESETFPSFARLVIRHCYKLNMVPREVARSSYFSIEADDCSMSAVNSVKQIKQEFDKYEDNNRSVSITDSLDDNDEMHKSRW